MIRITRYFAAPLLLAFLLAGLTVPAVAQDDAEPQASPPAGELTRSSIKFFTVDHSTFRYDEQHLQLDAYALIDRGYLDTEPGHDGGVQARYEITFKVMQDDSLLIGDSWVRTDWTKSDSMRSNGQKIPELVKYMIKPGDYRLAVRVVDQVKGTYYVEEYPISLDEIPEDEVAISDIMLASRIEKAAGDVGEFDHNGLLVLPNAERMFGATNPLIYYYVELYNLSTEADSATYWVDRALLDDGGEVIRRLDRRIREVPAENVVDVDAFSAATLRTGAYTLRVVVTDRVTGEQAVSDRSFWIFRPEEDVTFARRVDPGFDVDGLTEEELETELKAIRYLLNSKVRDAIKGLDGEKAKRAFLGRFWLANDPDTTTVVNEFRTEYLRRLDIANNRYGTLQREGWSTDRGRVLLMHGEPDYIDDHPFDSSVNGAWQMWQYDKIEGGVIFVFVDRNNLGEYTQVHSTKKGEVNNPQWYGIEFSR